ncbi:hypothetical protein AAG570_005219 [Ranatra chinensis]|uniref:Uncharacterized protein n=1 Tax=Ranatra chinensis TaxID=642074 RepID=A0ABD0XZT0_9HEMI
MFHKNNKQETTERGTCNLPPFCESKEVEYRWVECGKSGVMNDGTGGSDLRPTVVEGLVRWNRGCSIDKEQGAAAVVGGAWCKCCRGRKAAARGSKVADDHKEPVIGDTTQSGGGGKEGGRQGEADHCRGAEEVEGEEERGGLRVGARGHLHDIEEEEDEGTSSLGSSLGVSRQRVPCNSPSPPSFTKNGKKKKKKVRTRSVTSATTTSSSDTTATGRMQAEQGSLGELQKYHNRYLKNRRHTLANVR